MDRDTALDELAREWAREGKVGGPPTLWDLAVALARANSIGGDDADVRAAGAGGEDPGLPKAE